MFNMKNRMTRIFWDVEEETYVEVFMLKNGDFLVRAKHPNQLKHYNWQFRNLEPAVNFYRECIEMLKIDPICNLSKIYNLWYYPQNHLKPIMFPLDDSSVTGCAHCVESW